MLIFSMSVSVDGFIADRAGGFEWTAPDEELFRFHLSQVRALGGYLCGRRLYETMLVWETDPSLRENEPGAAFADVWCAIPKVVFSHTLASVQGNARLAKASLAEEVAAARDATDKDVSIGGAGLAAQAIELGLVDELRMFRSSASKPAGRSLLGTARRRRLHAAPPSAYALGSGPLVVPPGGLARRTTRCYECRPSSAAARSSCDSAPVWTSTSTRP